tara:strand:+ start:725 stop:925 length:201 start_codon:yes stop_codon:yes gene_type:complete
MLNVTINGDAKRVESGTVADMVRALGLHPEKLAVERNREIVPRGSLDQVMVEEGDVFEIVHFVGGG